MLFNLVLLKSENTQLWRASFPSPNGQLLAVSDPVVPLLPSVSFLVVLLCAAVVLAPRGLTHFAVREHLPSANRGARKSKGTSSRRRRSLDRYISTGSGRYPFILLSLFDKVSIFSQ